MLDARLHKTMDRFSLDVSLDAHAGSTTVVVGESGAGKTTLLRLLAGLATPDSGRIAIGDEIWFDPPSPPLSPSQRDVGYVAQDYALFPHLNVFENVAFGLRARGGLPRRDVDTRVHRTLDRLGIESLARRRPSELSGGQQQRVAIARALVLTPRLFLLDEPLSALDLQTKHRVRGELRSIFADLPCVTVYVTHHPVEAMALADRIAVIESGRLTQIGTREDLLRRPRSAYVGSFLGINLFRGQVVERTANGLATVQTDEGSFSVVDPVEATDVFAAVNPRDITIYLESPRGSAQNVFHGSIVEMLPEAPAGERVRLVLATRPPLVAEVTRHAVEAMGLHEGKSVFAAIKATSITVYE